MPKADTLSRDGLFITDEFPDLESVHMQLHPEAMPVRPSIDQYADALSRQGRLTPAVAESVENAKAVRESTSAVVYIAGPLTGVSEELKARYGRISDKLAGYPFVSDDKPTAFFGYVPHLHGTDPVKHPNVTAEEVRDIDFLWAGVTADIHVNFLHPMAHGNAIEEGWSESRLIPTIYLNPEGNRLSRLTLGMHNIRRNIDYDSFDSEIADEVALDQAAHDSLKNLLAGKRPAVDELAYEFDELHAWLRAFPGRDPREYHYLSFDKLVNPTMLAANFDAPEGLSIEEFFQTFQNQGLAVYIKDPSHKHRGKIGFVDYASDEKGIGVITRDGYPILFDVFTAFRSLSFWPVGRDSELAQRPEVRSFEELSNDPLFNASDVFGMQHGD